MWIDPDGVGHTVALPDPREAFAPALLGAVVAADQAELDRLTDLVDELFAALYRDLEHATPSDRLREVVIPEGTIRDAGSSDALTLVERVRAALLAVPDDFRLDALVATEDLLDTLSTPSTDHHPSHGNERTWQPPR